ncbi:MAG: type I restriction endonuclease subunit R [Nanoarchaeota archaeon]
MPNIITESEIEDQALQLLEELGYKILHGPDIACDGEHPERSSYSEVVLLGRLKTAIDKLNPSLPEEAKEEAVKKLLRLETQDLATNNYQFHRFLTEGISISYREKGEIVHKIVKLIDENLKNNEFLAINQFTIINGHYNRRPDIIIFVNGLPLAVIELKNPADEKATIWSAFSQLQTYKDQIPQLFHYNELLVTSDGLQSRCGSLTADKDRFVPWKTVHGKKPSIYTPEQDTLLRGIFDKKVFLDLISHFNVFSTTKIKGQNVLVKKLAAYHQYNAANNAVESTVKATHSDKRAGVVWHTQGSGKSLTMAFYAGKIILELNNPTIVVLTDRNDLDQQLFDTFTDCKDLLRQTPVQADSREKVKELLSVASGGVIFTTIQKFFPEIKGGKYPCLSDRKNIVVIADEAHRSQYDFIDGFARHIRDALPNASFIGFTGTPIEKKDKSTPAVFGKCVDIYDIEQAVEDSVTVKIWYESRLAKLDLKPEERPKIDEAFEEVTEQEEAESKEKLKSKWARLEKVIGSPRRLKRIAKDIVQHFEKRLETMEGKGMIVCMSRRICVELYKEIVKIRPEWHDPDDRKGAIKVIMTGNASEHEWQEHIRNKKRRKEIGDRLKDPLDPLKLVMVRDMWLTGFDAPCLHSMYVDKPMQGHGLMQAIARVNRVFKDKPGGLIVDYIGLADNLRNALANYTQGDRKQVGLQEEAVALTLEKYEIVEAMFQGFNYKKFFKTPQNEKLSFIMQAADQVLKQEDGKNRFLKNVTGLSQAFALAVPHETVLKLQDEVGFFQAVRSTIAKTETDSGRQTEELDSAIRQIVSQAVISDRIIDIFAAAGLKKPNISVLSEEFLAGVKELPQKNLAFEALKKLLNEEIKIRLRKNMVLGRSFLELLEESIRRYTNRNIEVAEIIENLVELGRKMRVSDERPSKLGLSEEETAFYDALETNNSAVKVLGDDKLKMIAREVVSTVKSNRSIDWTVRENVQAKLRVMVKRVLKKYGYPPDMQQKATDTVLEQAKLLAEEVTENIQT